MSSIATLSRIDDPQQFLSALDSMLKRAGAQAHHSDGRARRKFRSAMRRRAIQAWRKAHPGSELPRVPDAEIALAASAHAEPVIVLLPDDEDIAAPLAAISVKRNDRRAAKKSRQAFLRRVLAGASEAVRSAIGNVRYPGKGDTRGPAQGQIIALESFNAMIIRDLPRETATALESAGAQLLPDEPVQLARPIDIQKVVRTPGASDLWHLDKIGLLSAEVRRTVGSGKGAWIGFVDTGIDSNHPEFRGKSPKFRRFEADGRQSTAARDDNGHGTHVAAIAAGVNIGVAPAATIAMAAVLTGANGSGRVSQVLAGLQWLLDEAVESNTALPIINMSLGIHEHDSGRAAHAAGQRLAQLLSRDPDIALFVAAAGNNGMTPVSYPARLPEVFAVGATDPDDNVAPFSNWTPADEQTPGKPDICAPGVDICSAQAGGSYVKMSGTSMGAPIVSGVAALACSRPAAPGTVSLLAALLTSHTVPASPAVKAGAGRVDVRRL